MYLKKKHGLKGKNNLVIEQEIFIFLLFLEMPKNGFPIPTVKNGFHILNLHPKKHVSKKYPF